MFRNDVPEINSPSIVGRSGWVQTVHDLGIAVTAPPQILARHGDSGSGIHPSRNLSRTARATCLPTSRCFHPDGGGHGTPSAANCRLVYPPRRVAPTANKSAVRVTSCRLFLITRSVPIVLRPLPLPLSAWETRERGVCVSHVPSPRAAKSYAYVFGHALPPLPLSLGLRCFPRCGHGLQSGAVALRSARGSTFVSRR